MHSSVYGHGIGKMKFRILEGYAKIIEYSIISLLFILLFIVSLQILGRYVPFIPRFLWTVEIATFILMWIIFLGSIVGVRESRHFFVDIFSDTLKPGWSKTLKIIYYITMFAVAVIFLVYGHRFFRMGLTQNSIITGLNLGTVYIAVPLTGLSWVVFLTESFCSDFIGR
jgi:TRAP-type C4-dicarboxylate transport system permease small subunit